MAAADRTWRIVFLGPPNSGKGTQAAMLAKSLGVPTISTGEMLRAAVAQGSELGQRVEAVMAKGHLVSDDMMADVVRARLTEDDAANGYILDGYPRTLPQAETLDAILGERDDTEGHGGSLDSVIFVDAPEHVLLERALKRGRDDDTEEIARERQRVYRELTEPLEAFYEARDLLDRIDGAQTIDQVKLDIHRALGVGEPHAESSCVESAGVEP